MATIGTTQEIRTGNGNSFLLSIDVGGTPASVQTPAPPGKRIAQQTDIEAEAVTDSQPAASLAPRIIAHSVSEAQAFVSHEPGHNEINNSNKADKTHVTELSLEESRSLAQKFEEALNSTEIRFKVDIQNEDSHPLKFQVVDKKTGRVLRQFPPEKLLDLTEQAKSFKGVFLTKTA